MVCSKALAYRKNSETISSLQLCFFKVVMNTYTFPLRPHIVSIIAFCNNRNDTRFPHLLLGRLPKEMWSVIKLLRFHDSVPTTLAQQSAPIRHRMTTDLF